MKNQIATDYKRRDKDRNLVSFIPIAYTLSDVSFTLSLSRLLA